MTFLYPHKYWLASLIFALAVILASSPVLQWAQDEATRHAVALHDERAKVEKELAQLEDDKAEVQKLSGQISAEEIEKSLAPVDRLQAADALEKAASADRLDHFTYTLAPEEKVTIKNSAGTQELAVSTITIKADTPLDTDAWHFVEHLRGVFPGRLRPQQLTLERIGTDPAAENLHVTATFEWLSNGVDKQVAEGR